MKPMERSPIWFQYRYYDDVNRIANSLEEIAKCLENKNQ